MMVKEREILAEVLILINEQSRMLEGRLSDADLTQCTSRAEQIKQLLEVARRSSSQHALVSAKPPTPG
jgi:adenylate kinase